MFDKNIYRCISILFILVCFIIISFMLGKKNQYDISNVEIVSEDSKIHIEWDKFPLSKVDKIEVRIRRYGKDKNDSYYPIKHFFIDSDDEHFDFEEGLHGAKYRIYICAIYKDQTKKTILSTNKQFLEYEKMPNLPIINITTKNGTEPKSFRDISKGYVERTNEDVRAVITFNGMAENIQREAKICVRGNTSSQLPQKPYTLKFDENIKLIDESSSYKKWTLLALDGEYLNAYIGFSLSEICNMDYTPKTQFVNLIMNGDFRGMYLLCEDESGLINNGFVGPKGFIIERDPYYLDGENYLKTNNSLDNLAFSIKYPYYVSEEQYYDMEKYLNEIESYIMLRDSKLNEYIDYESFVKWLIIRDIMGHGDGWGSNAFYYIEEFEGDLTPNKRNKLKMGPLWDFDSAFFYENQFSAQHYLNECWFPYLLLIPSFEEMYNEYWEQNSDMIYSTISSKLDSLYEEHGEDLEMSYFLTCEKYKSFGANNKETRFIDEIDRYKALLSNQMIWIDGEIRSKECIE